jgi:phosphatidylglycerol:prolipoprotein diacylglycerol transferase
MPEGIPIQIGDFSYTIHFYGIIIMLGTLAGAFLSNRKAKRRGYPPDILWDMLIYLILGAVIGARIWHIFSPPPTSLAQGITTVYYLTHPFAAIAIWNGGLGLPGGVIGGVVMMYFYTRKHNLDFAVWLDIAAPGLALGQAIGRWGNFFNQELYGAPANLPWAIYIDPQHRMTGFTNQAYYHPLFLYESLWNLANMVLLLWLGYRFPDKIKKGELFLIYMFNYAIGRFLLDFLRLDASQVGGINFNQTAMGIVIVAVLIALVWRHRHQPTPFQQDIG